MKTQTLLPLLALGFASLQAHSTDLQNVSWAPGQVINSYAGQVYNIYGTYQNSGTINTQSFVTFMPGSSYTSYAGSMVNNLDGGVIHLSTGSTVDYEVGSGFRNYAGAQVINDATIINKGVSIFDAGSTVTGTGSYTQSEGGSIIVNGTLTQSGGIYITGNAYLGGSGTINGNVYASGADVVIAPGNSPGHITINGDLKMENGAKLVMQVDSLTDFDKITVSGNFDIGASRILFDVKPELKDSFLSQFKFNDFFEQVDSSGAVHAPSVATFSAASFEYGDATTPASTGGNALDVTKLVSSVPEPENNLMALAGLGLFACAGARRNKARRG